VSTVKTGKAVASVGALAPDWLRATAIVLSVLGILTAGYMTWAELTNNETVCIDAGSIDCAAVADSAYAKTFGIPVALLGLVGYVAILGVLVLEDQFHLLAAYGRTLVVGMALFGVIFQTYLTYVEAAVLEKWCQWCVASYVIITALLIIGALRLHSFFKPLRS
jgi:uncharacterized membrane protein